MKIKSLIDEGYGCVIADNDDIVRALEQHAIEIAEKLKEAISFWDLSENAEYEEARNEQAQVELRISDLEAQLKDYEIIKEDIHNDKVTMGSVVKLMNNETKEELWYKIVGSTEADILAKIPRISNESPVWKAILGKKLGDNVKVIALSGTFEYKITDIA